LLLRLGNEAKVVAPAKWRSLGVEAARRLLARYADAPAGRATS
jgi:hypothetical protein